MSAPSLTIFVVQLSALGMRETAILIQIVSQMKPHATIQGNLIVVTKPHAMKIASTMEILPMNTIQRLLFIIIVSNAGGQGKTTLGRIIKALLAIAGHQVQILDGDAGNAAASVVDASAKRLGWGAQTILSPDIVNYCTGKHVILDLGANAMASAREIVDMVPALTAAFEDAGYESLALFPLSSTKAGAAGAIERLAQLLPAQNKLLVLNDADGSGNFEPIDLPIDIARLEQLHPGFIAYVDALDSKSFGEAVMAPAPDHILASHIIGKWMKDFGKDLPFQDVFGPAIAKLSLLPEPKKNAFKVNKASRTCDRSLLKSAQKTQIIELLDEHGWDAAGLLRAHQILAKEESTAL